MKIFLHTHSTGIKGPGDFLEDYLLENGHTVLKLQHPLDDYNRKETVFTNNKENVAIYKRKNILFINYFIDFYLAMKHIISERFDVFIGANNFDTIFGIIARHVFKRDIRIIYFASDYSEERFKNAFLDYVYFLIEKIVIQHADFVISNTNRAANQRKKHGLESKKSIVIPNGIVLSQPHFKNKKIEKNSFIYVGNVTKEHGIVDLVSVLFPLMNHLIVIGQGDEWEKLKQLAEKKHISSEFHFQKDHGFVLRFLQNFEGFGLAPYNTTSKWTYYSSPLKIVEYICSSVPVITSNITEISEKVEKDKVGIVYRTLDPEILKEAIDAFDTDAFYKRAKTFYSEYNSRILYKKIPI